MRKPSKAAHTSNIAITGTSGFLGSTLLKNLDSNPRFRNILAIDRKQPPFKLKKAKWVSFDLIEGDADQKLAALFEKYKTKTVVHAALLTQPIRNLEEAHEVQSVGTMHLLNAAAAAPVHKLILASTTDVYGAFPDNPNFLTEEHLARGTLLSPFLKDKVEVEEQFLKFQKKHPTKVVTVLRPATILGPTVNNFKTHFFQNPLVPTAMGFDPLVQFVHESDVIRAFIKVLEKDHPGIFNVVAEGVIPLSRVIHILGKMPVPIPTVFLYPAADFLWYANIGVVPAEHIHFLKYLCIADGTKAWHKLKFKPVHTTLETLHSFNGRGLDKKEITRRLEEIEDATA
ncbi:MAG: NAD-dependent epimerase/dehydratase family protein [Deltaproteobacteria bacterium]|nr:NAD-dependent epimerase/dehydratase family protein [Deltaproteobacteria bacterium]